MNRIDRMQSETGREHPVVRRRRAASLDVTGDRRPSFLAGTRRDLVLEQRADATKPDVPERVDALVLTRSLNSPGD